VGYVQEATTEQVEQALNNAQAVQDIWARTAKDTRAVTSFALLT
jgi:RHH-type proline utilization regulon transcriptional repressor/proline dehydrogenase/delta 1-pyrroline-5-carboxylate dehydrogenase